VNTDFGIAMIEGHNEDKRRSAEKGIVGDMLDIVTNNLEVSILFVCKGTVVDDITETMVIAILKGYDHAVHKEWKAIKVFLVTDGKTIRCSRKR